MKIELREIIDSGAYADIYDAYDTQMERRVAAKVIRVSMQDQADIFAHGRALGAVSHPNVVTVHGVAPVVLPDDARVDALIMEFLDGRTLRAVVDAARQISRADLHKWSHEFLDGLEAIHSAGLVHGDLHGANIFVTPERLKILDIQSLRYRDKVSTLSQEGQRLNDVREAAYVLISIARIADAPLQAEVEFANAAHLCTSLGELRALLPALTGPTNEAHTEITATATNVASGVDRLRTLQGAVRDVLIHSGRLSSPAGAHPPDKTVVSDFHSSFTVYQSARLGAELDVAPSTWKRLAALTALLNRVHASRVYGNMHEGWDRSQQAHDEAASLADDICNDIRRRYSAQHGEAERRLIAEYADTWTRLRRATARKCANPGGQYNTAARDAQDDLARIVARMQILLPEIYDTASESLTILESVTDSWDAEEKYALAEEKYKLVVGTYTGAG